MATPTVMMAGPASDFPRERRPYEVDIETLCLPVIVVDALGKLVHTNASLRQVDAASAHPALPALHPPPYASLRMTQLQCSASPTGAAAAPAWRMTTAPFPSPHLLPLCARRYAHWRRLLAFALCVTVWPERLLRAPPQALKEHGVVTTPSTLHELPVTLAGGQALEGALHETLTGRVPAAVEVRLGT